MYKLYSHRSKRLLGWVRLNELNTRGDTYSLSIAEGYRNIRKSWQHGAKFILDKDGDTRVILIPLLPTDKGIEIDFVFIEPEPIL